MSSDSDSDESKGAQVRISLKLAASVADRSLEVPTQPIAVPADIGRQGLSAVLNHLLGRRSVASEKDGDDDNGSESDEDDDEDDSNDKEKLPPLNFEFILAKNRLLRKGVEKEARQHGIGLEEAVQITYFPAADVPELGNEEEKLPDWVSCLSLENSTLFSGSYDGSLNIYRTSGDDSLEKLCSSDVSTGPIKCLKTVKLEDKTYIAIASLDHTLNIHTYDENSGGLESYGSCLQERNSFAVSALDFTSKGLLASGDGNGSIDIWDVSKGEYSTGAGKKRKTAEGSEVKKKINATISIESAHTQLVSGLSWGRTSESESGKHLISGSWDHSIKLWDVEKQDCLLTLNGSRVVSCLDTSYHSEGVVATGHPDCTIRLWDVRVNSSKQTAVVSDSTFRPSHRAWISSVHWNPSNAYHLASASHDGTVKLWDIRSSNPLHTVRVFNKEEKALCLVWGGTDGEGQRLFTGGTECVIKHVTL